MTARDAARKSVTPAVTAILSVLSTLLANTLTVRDEIRDLRAEVHAEVRALKCDVAVGFKRLVLPEGCTLNMSAIVAPVVQAGEPQGGSGVTR